MASDFDTSDDCRCCSCTPTTRGTPSMRAELAEILSRCSDDEIESFLYMARRVDKARAIYGALDLDSDTRDWAEEERQEHADAAMYQAFRRVKEARSR